MKDGQKAGAGSVEEANDLREIKEVQNGSEGVEGEKAGTGYAKSR